MKRNLKTVPQFAADTVFTVGQIRFWVFDAPNNGLEKAGGVVRIQRRVYIDVDGFDRWIEAQQPQRVAA